MIHTDGNRTIADNTSRKKPKEEKPPSKFWPIILASFSIAEIDNLSGWLVDNGAAS
jgi:hypothetical protein